MTRVFNFSAGPATIPEEVLVRAREELLEHGDAGMSVLEMSHRSHFFEDIIANAETSLRTLMKIPTEYRVLFLQGGASLQFAMLPMNLMTRHKRAAYLHTGLWTKKAIAEGKKFGEVLVPASSEAEGFNHIPDCSKLAFDNNLDYVWICSNNTIYGTRYRSLPATGNIPLVADMSSHILSEAMEVERFGIIFAGAQKNIGPAGVCVVIVREDLLGRAGPQTPAMLDYAVHAKEKSLYNTPPTFGIYMASLVFDWLLEQGGVEAVQKTNEDKAGILYQALDESKLFRATVAGEHRSLMNVPFVTGNADLDKAFLSEAERRGLTNLKGHRSVGGMRASIYNAMPRAGVEALVELLRDFEKQHANQA